MCLCVAGAGVLGPTDRSTGYCCCWILLLPETVVGIRRRSMDGSSFRYDDDDGGGGGGERRGERRGHGGRATHDAGVAVVGGGLAEQEEVSRGGMRSPYRYGSSSYRGGGDGIVVESGARDVDLETTSRCGGGGGGGGTSPFVSPVKQNKKQQQVVSYSDRFIPSRAGTSRLDFSVLEREDAASQTPNKYQQQEKDESNSVYGMLLKSQLLGCPPAAGLAAGGGGSSGTPTPHEHGGGSAGPTPSQHHGRMFKYSNDKNDVFGAPTQSPYSRGLLDGDDGLSSASFVSPGRLPRRINRSPFKVLDAPSLADDFYLNLVDWSAMNTLAVGLGSCVYLWSACTSKVTRLVDLGDDSRVCSVAWSQRGHYLSLGTDAGDVQIWDVSKCRRLRTMQGHRQRVGCMSWSHHTLATGSRDRGILMRDVRSPEGHFAKYSSHRSEVCGLKWSPDDRELASGGNDNQLMIWQPGHGSSSDPVRKFSGHTAAVKAIAWSPHQHGLIASGGGTADRCIKFWNTSSGTALNSVDTGSQVCNLAWSKNVNEIVSTHGYSQNQIIVWRYQGMQKLATLTGHAMRVLYLACSPDGQTIVTGAGDETLRFWNVFPGLKAQSGGDAGVGSMMRTVIR